MTCKIHDYRQGIDSIWFKQLGRRFVQMSEISGYPLQPLFYGLILIVTRETEEKSIMFCFDHDREQW